MNTTHVNNGHTPHQFAVTRILFGVYLVIHFTQLISWTPDVSTLPRVPFFPNVLDLFDSNLATQIFVGVLAALSMLFTMGIYRRPISILICYGWFCFFNQNVLSFAYVGWLLVAFSLVPSGEPWSLSRRNQDWRMQPIIFWGAWFIMAAGYLVSGVFKLRNPDSLDGSVLQYATLALEILFAPLCMFRFTRSFAWLAMVFMHIGILLTINFPDLPFGILLIHLFTLDPSWSLRAKVQEVEPVVFFDGVCNLCNGFINFIVAENRGLVLRVAPLQGETATLKLAKNLSKDMSTVVFFENGRVYSKSSAVLRIAMRLGGIWSAGVVFFVVPKFLRDLVYDFIANHRYAWFGKSETCRLPSDQDRKHFLP